MCNVPRCAVQQVQGGNLQTEDDGSRISSDTVTATTASPGYQHTGPWVCVLALIVKCDWKLSDRSSSPGPAHMAHRAVWTSLARTTDTAGARFPLTTLRQVQMEIEIGDLEYQDI